MKRCCPGGYAVQIYILISPYSSVHYPFFLLSSTSRSAPLKKKKTRTVRFIHQSKDNLRIRLILRRQLAPQTSELRIRWSTLSNNCSIPPRIVMDINHASSTRCQASLDQQIIGRKVGTVECSPEIVVHEVLPANWETEDIMTSFGDEVGHLTQAVGAIVEGTESLLERKVSEELELEREKGYSLGRLCWLDMYRLLCNRSRIRRCWYRLRCVSASSLLVAFS